MNWLGMVSRVGNFDQSGCCWICLQPLQNTIFKKTDTLRLQLCGALGVKAGLNLMRLHSSQFSSRSPKRMAVFLFISLSTTQKDTLMVKTSGEAFCRGASEFDSKHET